MLTALFSLAFFACASEPPPRTSPPLMVDGVRQIPLKPEDVEQKIRDKADIFRACYLRESVNVPLDASLSDYVLLVRVPNDGSGAKVEVTEESVAGQVSLSGCIADAVRSILFPKHVGESITLQVPIKGPK